MINLVATDTLQAKAGTGAANVTYTLVSGDELSSGADSFKPLATGSLATSAATLYTTPASTQTFIKEITLANTSGSDVTGVIFYRNGSATTNQLTGTMTVPANGTLVYSDGKWTPYNSAGLPISTGVSSVSNSDGSLTISPTTGAVVASINQLLNNTPAAGGILFTNEAAPSTPASGKTVQYVDSTSKNMASKNDAGTVNHGVQTRTATASNWIRAIADDGSTTISQPAVTDLSGLGTGVATFLGTPTSANLASALTDETGSGAAVFANAPTIKPKDIEGEVWIDPSNTQGWSGSDVGAQINSAYSYITTNWYNSGNQTGGGIINIAPGNYTQTTAITANTAGLSITIQGAGDGWGATVLVWGNSTGTALSLGGGGSNAGGVHLRNITLSGGFPINTGSTGVSLTGAYGSFTDCAIVRFGTGVNWPSASTYGFTFVNTKVIFCTTGYVPLGENNVWIGGLIAGCTGSAMNFNGSAEGQMFGLAFDDNDSAGSVGAIAVSNASSRISLDGCRFENAGLGASIYIKQSAGSVSMVSGAFQEDRTSSVGLTGFVQQTGGVGKYDGVWHGLATTGATTTFTQIYNASAPASLTVVNPILAPGSGAAAANALNWTPNGYDVASAAAVTGITTGTTIIKQRVMAPNSVEQGSTFRFFSQGTQTTTGSVTYRIHIGTAGTSADTVVASVATPVTAASGAGVAGALTIRTLGSAGTCMAGMHGVGSTVLNSTQTATATVNTGTTNFVTLTAAASSGTHAANINVIEVLPPN